MERINDIPTRRDLVKRAGWLICGLSLAQASTAFGCSNANQETQTKTRKTVDDIELTPTSEALSLLWFTDIHGAEENLAEIAQFKADNADYVCDALCTGDTMPTSSEDDFDYWTQAGAAGTFICIGNHDRASSENAFDSELPVEDAYKRYLAPFASLWTDRVTLITNRTFYSVDYPEHNVLLLATDCNIQSGSLLNEEVAWFTQQLAYASAQGKAVIAASHFPPAGADLVTCDFTVAGSEPSTSKDHVTNQQLIEAIDDFMANGGEFITWMCGHRHIDMVEVLEDHPGQMAIIQSCAIQSRERGDLVRNEDDASANCFTYVVFDRNNHTFTLNRFGARTTTYGASRTQLTIDYLNKKIVS